MYNAFGMQSDKAGCDVVPAHEIPVYVIKHLIRIDIAAGELPLPSGRGFQLRRPLRAQRISLSGTTDAASTGSSGHPARQYPQPFAADILRRIDVAVVVSAAAMGSMGVFRSRP